MPSHLSVGIIPSPSPLSQETIPYPSHLLGGIILCPPHHYQAIIPYPSHLSQETIPSPSHLSQGIIPIPLPFPKHHSHLSRGRLSILLSSSSCRWSFSCSFWRRSSTSRSRAAVSTGLAPPKMEAARLDWAAGAPEVSSSLGALRGFRLSFGLWVGPGKEPGDPSGH